MNNYDVIVVGAGNSGLMSALSLLNDGKKVLLLDEHNQIGGTSKSIRKGRFEFSSHLHQLYINNNNNEKYKLSNILKRCGVTEDISWSYPDELFRIITSEHDYSIPFGTEKFLDAIESYVPDSRYSVATFLNLASECREALDYIYKKVDNIDYEYLKSEYNNFLRVSSYSLSRVLDAIHVPVAAQEIINAMWPFLGSSETELSFVTYATFIINLIEYGIKIPTYGNFDIASFIANNFLERGGTIRLNCKITNLIIEDNTVNGVILEDGNRYYCDKIIMNSSLDTIYTKLVNPSNVPEKAKKAINNRTIGGKILTINLGLNRTVEEIGLTDYLYLIYQSLDSDILYSEMKDRNHKNLIAYVHNNINKNASPVGTCSITLHAIYFSDCLGSSLNSENYFNELHNIAKNLITTFEKTLNVKIMDYIEEIDIESPIDTAAINNSPEGNSYGYILSRHDDLLPRMLNKKNENYTKGLEICGGFDCDAYGYASSFISGVDSAANIQKEGEL